MNGKKAKMLRKMGKDSKADKRLFNRLDQNTKSVLTGIYKQMQQVQAQEVEVTENV